MELMIFEKNNILLLVYNSTKEEKTGGLCYDEKN